jgi:hypothetical protein
MSEPILLSERMPAGLRVFMVLVGLFPFIAPYELLLRPGWREFNLALLISILVSLGAVAVGLICLAAGLFGLNQTLRLDPSTHTLIYTYETALTPLRKRVYRFEDLTNLEVTCHDWSDGPSTCSLRLFFSDRKKIELGHYKNRPSAEADRARLAQAIAA